MSIYVAFYTQAPYTRVLTVLGSTFESVNST